METQVKGQSQVRASREFSKKLLMLAVAGGAAFWIIDFVISVSPIAAEYQAAFSISSLPVALGGVCWRYGDRFVRRLFLASFL